MLKSVELIWDNSSVALEIETLFVLFHALYSFKLTMMQALALLKVMSLAMFLFIKQKKIICCQRTLRGTTLYSRLGGVISVQSWQIMLHPRLGREMQKPGCLGKTPTFETGWHSETLSHSSLLLYVNYLNYITPVLLPSSRIFPVFPVSSHSLQLLLYIPVGCFPWPRLCTTPGPSTHWLSDLMLCLPHPTYNPWTLPCPGFFLCSRISLVCVLLNHHWNFIQGTPPASLFVNLHSTPGSVSIWCSSWAICLLLRGMLLGRQWSRQLLLCRCKII